MKFYSLPIDVKPIHILKRWCLGFFKTKDTPYGRYQTGRASQRNSSAKAYSFRRLSVATSFIVLSSFVSGLAQTSGGLTFSPASGAANSTTTVSVNDIDVNTTGAADTVNVTLTNTNTNEVETITLTETGGSTGIFSASFTFTPGAAAGANNDGSMNARTGDTISGLYDDALNVANVQNDVIANFSVTSGGNFGTDAIVTVAAQTAAGAGVSMEVNDSDRNADAGNRESLTAVAVNLRTGESETVNFIESADNNGRFVANLLTSDSSSAGSSNDGNMNVQAGDVIELRYEDALNSSGTSITRTAQGNITNTAPVAVDDPSVAGAAGSSVDINVLANDTDVDGQTLSVTSVSTPSQGTATILANGQVQYTANAGATGTDTFTYDISDGFGGTDTATVTVTFGNTAPTANLAESLNNIAGSDVVIDLRNFVSRDDTNTPLDNTSCWLSNGAGTGEATAVTWTNEGRWEVDTNCILTFTPDDFTVLNPRDITYRISDTDGDTSNYGTIRIGYQANRTPTAVDDSATTAFETAIALNVLDGSRSNGTADSDPDGDSLTVTVTTGPSNGTLSSPSGGVITYTPNNGHDGADSFTYTIDDGKGGTDVGEVTITTEVLNPASPTANNDNFTINSAPVAGTAYTTGRATNNDTVGDTQIIVGSGLFFVNGANTATNTYTDSRGTFLINGTADIIFTPSASFVGPSTTIDYTIADADGDRSNVATIAINFSGTANSAPVAVNNTSNNNTLGDPVTVNVLNNDTDSDGSIDPTTVVLSQTNVAGQGVWSVNGTTGVVTFTPASGFTGDPTPITYTVDDNQGATSAPATITVTYAAATNSNPVANDDSDLNNTIGSTVSFNVTNNDTDSDGTIDPATVVLSQTNVAGEGVWSVNSSGVVTFTPASGFTGNPTPIAYTVNDDQGGTSALATITVTYAAATNSAPVAVNNTSNNNTLGDPVTVNVLNNDTDADGNGTIDPATVVLSQTNVAGEGVWSVNGTTGVVTFTPASGFTGDPTPITYTVNDDQGATSAPATITVRYAAATNSNPVANDDSDLNNTLGDPVTVNVLNNDTDADGNGTIDPATVVLSQTNVAGEGVWSVNGTTGVVTFTPASGFTGDPTPITYTVNDDQGGTSALATITVTYAAPTNSDPVAVNDSRTTRFETPIAISVLDNDTDTNGDTLSVQSTTPPSNGTISISNNVITYTPNAGFTGTDSFTYTASDGVGGTDTATVTVDVSAFAFDFTVTKTTLTRNARIGEAIAYTIQVTNNNNQAENGVSIIDILPAGLVYVEDSAQIDGVAVEPTINGRELRWENRNFAANASQELTILTTVGAGIAQGQSTENTAYINNAMNLKASNSSKAIVRIQADEIFDCSAVIGKVFNDLNQNGIQNNGERGIAGARLITTRGLNITTDEYGRYHIPCAAAPNLGIGSNYIVKLDRKSLPIGYTIFTENPRVVRLTPGKLAEANFGVTTPTMLELAVETYDNPVEIVMQSMLPNIDAAISALLEQKAMLRLVVVGNKDNQAILGALEAELRQRWREAGAPYTLNIQHHTTQPIVEEMHSDRR